MLAILKEHINRKANFVGRASSHFDQTILLLKGNLMQVLYSYCSLEIIEFLYGRGRPIKLGLSTQQQETKYNENLYGINLDIIFNILTSVKCIVI